MVIQDSGNPNASAAGLWVGLVQQPNTSSSVYDFQEWVKPYQFWVKTDSNGNFTIPDGHRRHQLHSVCVWARGAGHVPVQAQAGGSPPNSLTIPAAPFSVTVTGGATNALGTVTWTPARVGADGV